MLEGTGYDRKIITSVVIVAILMVFECLVSMTISCLCCQRECCCNTTHSNQTRKKHLHL